MANIEHIASLCDNAFGKRGSLLSLWQEIGDNFYPERAEFTSFRSLGTDFAANLTTSMPLIARRDLGDMFSSMLRPTDVFWFKTITNKQDILSHEAKLWLENASKTQWNAMYDKHAKFQRATKECDQDYAAFGQGVISKEFLTDRQQMLYRTWHLRDVAWMEDMYGDTCPIFRKDKQAAHNLNKEFRGNVSKEVKDLLADPKTMFTEVHIAHAVVTPDMLESDKKWRTPYVSIFYEKATKHILREEGSWTKIYSIPRWQTVSGSPYAYSPATVASLPDARLIQQMTLVLLEAGEKAVNPPLIATQEVVRSDVNQYAGGTTWVDAEYDERFGEALRPMNINSNGIPHGMQMREEVKQAIEAAFYLDKIGLPEMNGDMTAFETAQRVKEYMRKIVPLFSPVNDDYNGDVCEGTFELLFRNGVLGRMQDVPEELLGADIKFQFASPLSETLDRQKAQSFAEARQMIAETIPLDQTAARNLDIRKALRDALSGIGISQSHFVPEEEMQAMDEADAKAQQMQAMMQTMQQGAMTAETMGGAAKNFAAAGVQA